MTKQDHDHLIFLLVANSGAALGARTVEVWGPVFSVWKCVNSPIYEPCSRNHTNGQNCQRFISTPVPANSEVSEISCYRKWADDPIPWDACQVAPFTDAEWCEFFDGPKNVSYVPSEYVGNPAPGFMVPGTAVPFTNNSRFVGFDVKNWSTTADRHCRVKVTYTIYEA